MLAERDDAAVRAWRAEAIRRIEADFNRSADTHLIRLDLPRYPSITLHLKDEAVTRPAQPEAPAGAVAVPLCAVQWLDQAGYLRHRGVVGIDGGQRGLFRPDAGAALDCSRAGDHRGTQAGRDPLPGRRDPRFGRSAHHLRRCQQIAAETGSHYLDQFTFAERQTDWRGNNNIAESIFALMSAEAAPFPAWVVCGAGTAGTSATIGRYLAYQRHRTRG